MSKVIVVANQKGGVAKTTTSVNLAAYLGSFGKSVLFIDLDPQANATSALGINKEGVEKSIYDVLLENETLESTVLPTPSTNVSICPGHLSLVGAEVELVHAVRRDSRLKDAFLKNSYRNKYDFVIVDTPPSLGLLTINALAAADSVLIPMQCEYFALEGLAQLYKTIQLIRQKTNPALAIEGLVFSMVDPRANLTQQVMVEVKNILKDKVYETVIPRNIRLAEAPSFGKTILTYDKSSKGAEAYEKLAKEFLNRNGITNVAPVDRPADSQEPGSQNTVAVDPGLRRDDEKQEETLTP